MSVGARSQSCRRRLTARDEEPTTVLVLVCTQIRRILANGAGAVDEPPSPSGAPAESEGVAMPSAEAGSGSVDPAGLGAAAARLSGGSRRSGRAALAVLGARGLAGFDTNTSRYFHRELPFDLDRIEAMQPRLKNARKLLEDGGIQVLGQPRADAHDVQVPGTDVAHHVRLRPGGDRCSCPWFSKHQGERGPCKHILAARMFTDAEELEQDGASVS